MTIGDVTVWLEANQLLVFSLIVPIASGLIAYLAAWYSSRQALHANLRNLIHQEEAKFSDFRQAWIDGVRDDLSELTAHLAASDYNDAAVRHRAILLVNRVRLRLNRNDPEYEKFMGVLVAAVEEANENAASPKKVSADSQRELIEVAQGILKREWDRLKKDLRSARLGKVN